MNKILKEGLKNVIIIVLILTLIKVSYFKFILKENPVKLFGFAFLIVGTGSMEPEIQAGELIIIKEKKNYEKEDIVTYLDKDGFLTTHRIVEINNEYLITKGDNNDLNDEKINFQNIKGKVVFHSKILGIFVYYYLKPIVFLYVMYWIFSNIYEGFFVKENLNEKGVEENEI